MEEKTIWKGSSVWTINVGTYALCALLAGLCVGLAIVINPLVLVGLVVPLALGLQKSILNRTRVYEVTSERVKVASGILTRRTDEMELYRVTDTALVEPLLLRLFGAGNVVLTTMDQTNPSLTLEAVPNAAQLREDIRKCVEDCRSRKRVRVAELE